MAPCDETEGFFQEGLEARSSQIPGQHLALGAPSLNKQNPAGISSSPEARAHLKAAKENCLGKVLFAPCATPALAEGNSWHSCAWTRPSGFPSISTGPPAAAHPCLLWVTPAHPSCLATSPTQLLQPSQKIFQLELHTDHGFQPTAPGVSAA